MWYCCVLIPKLLPTENFHTLNAFKIILPCCVSLGDQNLYYVCFTWGFVGVDTQKASKTFSVEFSVWKYVSFVGGSYMVAYFIPLLFLVGFVVNMLIVINHCLLSFPITFFHCNIITLLPAICSVSNFIFFSMRNANAFSLQPTCMCIPKYVLATGKCDRNDNDNGSFNFK